MGDNCVCKNLMRAMRMCEPLIENKCRIEEILISFDFQDNYEKNLEQYLCNREISKEQYGEFDTNECCYWKGQINELTSSFGINKIKRALDLVYNFCSAAFQDIMSPEMKDMYDRRNEDDGDVNVEMEMQTCKVFVQQWGCDTNDAFQHYFHQFMCNKAELEEPLSTNAAQYWLQLLATMFALNKLEKYYTKNKGDRINSINEYHRTLCTCDVEGDRASCIKQYTENREHTGENISDSDPSDEDSNDEELE